MTETGPTGGYFAKWGPQTPETGPTEGKFTMSCPQEPETCIVRLQATGETLNNGQSKAISSRQDHKQQARQQVICKTISNMQEAIDNRRIAKNTLYLYLRMLIIMAVTLYTSRVILQTLGIDDFGIYNVIGGVIVLFNFVSTSLRTSTQRFISYCLGENDTAGVYKAFNTSLECHLILVIVLIILAETIGLWFFNRVLIIPPDRIEAARWVYQLSVLTFLFNFMQMPYQAAIIAHEKMHFFTIASIIDAVLKLALVWLLIISPIDKLVFFSILMCAVSIISLLIPATYCYAKLKLQRPRIIKDKKLFKQILGFSGWTMYNGAAVVGAQQGGNMLINIFSGVAANGAFAIANKVSSAVYDFVSNFQSAFHPQIIKSYANGQHKEMYQLMERSSAISYYLMLILAVPFLLETDYILTLWLGSCPEFASGFCRLMIIYFLIDALQAPLWMLIGATGKYKVYALWNGTLTLLNIPISWILLSKGFSVYWIYIVRVIINFTCCVIRPIYVKHLIADFSLQQYLIGTIAKVATVTILVAAATFALRYFTTLSSLKFILLNGLLTTSICLFAGFGKSERTKLLDFLTHKTSNPCH